jgi:hypothetical protein
MERAGYRLGDALGAVISRRLDQRAGKGNMPEVKNPRRTIASGSSKCLLALEVQDELIFQPVLNEVGLALYTIRPGSITTVS